MHLKGIMIPSMHSKYHSFPCKPFIFSGGFASHALLKSDHKAMTRIAGLDDPAILSTHFGTVVLAHHAVIHPSQKWMPQRLSGGNALRGIQLQAHAHELHGL